MSTQKYTFSDLINVMARLRDPDGGCPWDLEQSFETIAKHTVEEAYEVQDAILNKDLDNLKEELGDLLFQSVYHAQMAAEQKAFTIDDVIHDVTDKMIFRHPHVFGDKNATSATDVDAIWDQQKSQEKGKANKSTLDGVPLALPALLRAHKLQKKAAKVGFEWDDISGVLDKLEEEIKEVEDAKANGTDADIQDELGDVLFVLVNYIRMSGYDAEDLLNKANHKFASRFSLMEDLIKSADKDITVCNLAEKEKYWQQAKTQLKADVLTPSKRQA